MTADAPCIGRGQLLPRLGEADRVRHEARGSRVPSLACLRHSTPRCLSGLRHRLERGPLSLAKGTAASDDGAFVVEDGRYVSARWPGDAYAFARRILARLETATGAGRDEPERSTAATA